MDKLETTTQDGWIHVAFANYIPGKDEKIPK